VFNLTPLLNEPIQVYYQIVDSAVVQSMRPISEQSERLLLNHVRRRFDVLKQRNKNLVREIFQALLCL
jgi:uncharacterized protein YbcI